MPVQTMIYFSPTPPESVTAGESVKFYIYLYYSTDSAWYPLAGVPVELWVDYSKVASGHTDSLGRCIISHSFTRGTHLIYAHFPGWELGWPPVWYPPSTTSVYTIYAVGIETSMDIYVPSPDVGVGEPFYAWGYLKEVLPPPPEGPGPRGLLDKTVELYVDGSMIRSERTGFSVPKGWPGYDPGRWRFAVPAFQTLGAHTVEVKFPGDEIYDPCSSGVIEFNAIESEVVATIENRSIPTKVAPREYWEGRYYLCNRGTGAGNIRAVVITEGDVVSEIPILTMAPGECVRLEITGSGPTSFTIRTGV